MGLCLFGLEDLPSRLDFAVDNHVPEPVLQQVPFWLQSSQGILQFICQNDFERGGWYPVADSVSACSYVIGEYQIKKCNLLWSTDFLSSQDLGFVIR